MVRFRLRHAFGLTVLTKGAMASPRDSALAAVSLSGQSRPRLRLMGLTARDSAAQRRIDWLGESTETTCTHGRNG